MNGDSLQSRFAEALQLLLPDSASQHGSSGLCVAFSGGLDSTVLLHLAAGFARENSTGLRALHVNHGMQAASDEWAKRCGDVCNGLDVPFTTIAVDVDAAGSAGPEAAARDARYAAFAAELNKDECLLLAQHQDDQLETVLLQLMRGAGVRGLAAMPAVADCGTGFLARPLLGERREVLEDYARDAGLSWIDDPSNFDTELDRNYLRHRLLPLLQERWPSAAATVSRSARWCAEADGLLTELAEKDARGFLLGNTLALESMKGQSEARRRNLLRYLIAEAGLPMPPEARLNEALRTMLTAAADTAPEVVWPGARLCRYRYRIYALPEEAAPPQGGMLKPGASLDLGSGNGVLELAGAADGICLKCPEEGLGVSYRQGGERITPVGSAQSRSLKNLFQEYAVLPWMRERIPLLYAGDELVAVGDLWVAEGWQAEPGEGCRLVWSGAGQVQSVW